MEGTFREPLSSSSRGGGRKRPGHKLPKTTETPVLRQGALYAASTRWDGTARRAGEDQRALQEAAWVVGGRVRFPPRRPLRSYGTGGGPGGVRCGGWPGQVEEEGRTAVRPYRTADG